MVIKRIPLGKIEFVKEGNDMLSIKLYDSLESFYKENSDKPICHMTRGFLKYMTELYIAKQVEVAETRCRSMDDSFCQFKLKIMRI